MFCFVGIVTNGRHTTRLGGTKQEIQDLKSGFEYLINQIKVNIDVKFSEINVQLEDIKETFASTVNDTVTESILNVKDSIIETFREENIKLQKNVETLKLGYLIWKKLQINMTRTLGERTLKYMAYQ